VDRPRGEAALDDDVGLGEAGLDVTLLVLERAGDVRRLAVELHEVVQDRRIGRDRVVDLDDMRQHLVVDLDQSARRGGDLLAGRGDRGDGVAVPQRLFARHHVACHPAHVLDAERVGRVDREVDDVGRRHHRLDAGQRLGLRGVDATDDGMRVRAAQHLAPDHAGHVAVGGEGRAAGDLVDAVGTDRALADPLEILLAHTAAPRMSAAVSCGYK
jgi:hypothetical protein